ncbi:MAG: hypothetical protein ACRD82_22910, partial [Blastocatellia bacterium]
VAQSPNSIEIFCSASGIENAVSFSLRFGADKWEFASSSIGDGFHNATVWVNANQALTGRIGFALALPPNRTLSAGHRLIAVLTFRQRLGNIAPLFSQLAVEFADQPIAREVVSAEAQSLRANFASDFLALVTQRLAAAQTRRR